MEAAASGPPAILLLGDSASGKNRILKALLGDSRTQIFTFDTKYYTATASLIAAEGLDPAQELQTAWEAVLLIFDITRLVAPQLHVYSTTATFV